MTDAVELTNTGDHVATNTGCSGPNVSPRTSGDFPAHHFFCAGGAGPSVPAHASIRIAWTSPHAPGAYWVWFDYFYGPSSVGNTAYAKLTVVRPSAATIHAPSFAVPSAGACAHFNRAVHMLDPGGTPHPVTAAMDFGSFGEKPVAWLMAEQLRPRESITAYACDWQGKSLSKSSPDIQDILTVMHLSHPLTRAQALQVDARIIGSHPPHWARVARLGTWGMRLGTDEWFAKGDAFIMFTGGGLRTRRQFDLAMRVLASELS